MKKLAAIVVFIVPAVVWAEPRSGDTRFDSAALESHLTGRMIEFFDGSKSRYASDFTYGYTYVDDGPMWTGTWSTDDESRVCVAFDNGSARCDHIVLDGARTILITEDGERFPVRNQTVLPQ